MGVGVGEVALLLLVSLLEELEEFAGDTGAVDLEAGV